MDHRKRFALLLIFIYIISLPIISAVTYIILKQNAIDNAYNMARLYLESLETTRQYVSEGLRPILQKELPGRFIVEGMSGAYVAGSVAKRVLQELPGHVFKHASLNPINPKNKADEFEKNIINNLRAEKELIEWKGVIERQGYKYYVLAHPGLYVEARCLYCHGDPVVAPMELIERYGTTSGFYKKEGKGVDALFVYIPVNVPIASARKSVAIFISIYTVFFGLVFWLINRRFKWFYEKIESDKHTIEDINAEVLNLNRDMEDIVAERTMSIICLRVADRIRNPVTVIGGIGRQLLKKGIEGISREKLEDILSECQKMERTVTDFDELVKNKRFLFKREDLNEITTSAVRFVEQESKNRGIFLSVNLSDKPLMFNANRQLIKIAVRHVINNAIDATLSGGKIIIFTKERDEDIVLTVTDEGKGMTSEELHKVFEPFYSTKGRTGMGLSLVKQIVTEHMGEITIDSKLNVGTTIQFIFLIRWSSP